jgi:hypothetical protein
VPFAQLADDDPVAPWQVTVEWAFTGGRAVPVAVELRSMTEQPVTAEAWRTVTVREVVDWTRFRLREAGRMMARGGRTGVAGKAAALEEPPRRPVRGPSYPDAHYQRVADLYAEALVNGSTSERRYIAEALESTGLPEYRRLTQDNRVKGWLRECRHRGLIDRKG